MSELLALTEWSWIFGVVGLLSAFGIYGYVKRQPSGTDEMSALADEIHDGAMAFLRREYSVLAVFVVIVAILLYVAIGRATAMASSSRAKVRSAISTSK